MTVTPKSIAPGKCYLSTSEGGPRMLRVIAILDGNRVQYEFRNCYGRRLRNWRAGLLKLDAFARMAEREVPCDWIPEQEE